MSSLEKLEVRIDLLKKKLIERTSVYGIESSIEIVESAIRMLDVVDDRDIANPCGIGYEPPSPAFYSTMTLPHMSPHYEPFDNEVSKCLDISPDYNPSE